MKTCILHTRITFRIFEVEPQRLQVSARRGTRQRCAKYGLWRSSPSIGTSSRRPALSACELLIADSVVTGEVYLCSSFRIHSKHRNNSMNSTGNAKLTCIYANFHSLQFTTQNILSIVATKHTFSQLNTRLDNNMLTFLRESAIIVYYFRDRSMLQNAYLLANFCADTAENEPNIATKLTIICQLSAKLPRSASEVRFDGHAYLEDQKALLVLLELCPDGTLADLVDRHPEGSACVFCSEKCFVPERFLPNLPKN